MPKTLPANLIIEKNRLHSGSAWLILLDITLVNPANPADTQQFRLARNTEDVTFDSETYVAFPFEIEPSETSSTGEIPTVTLRVSNITRLMQPYLEAYDGGVGSSATIIVVNAGNLEESYASLTMDFDVLTCHTNSQWVEFSLGAPNPLRRRFPLSRYYAQQCPWQFKSVECAYSGAETTCSRTLEACQAYANTERFGGYPGLKSDGIRLA